MFFKPPSALVGPDGAVELPPPAISERVEHEAEIAVVVGRRLRRASLEEAAAAIFGVTLALDVTARDLQKKDGQWTRAKGMDTFCPVGPIVVARVLERLAAGRCAQEIALDMGLSLSTVHTHLERISARTGARGPLALLAAVLRFARGGLPPP